MATDIMCAIYARVSTDRQDDGENQGGYEMRKQSNGGCPKCIHCIGGYCLKWSVFVDEWDVCTEWVRIEN